MAIQAQYPSNVLLLNRNTQEGHAYSLQPQPGGFLDQSHMLLNNGGGSTANSRKRVREGTVDTRSIQAGHNNTVNHFSIQPQSQLIDLSQLHNPPQNVVSTGLRLSFSDHQHRQNHGCQSSAFLTILNSGFASQMKQQRDEIDQILQAQGEKLRRTLADKRQRHYRELLSAAEESVARRLREKEVEVENATRRNAELEARAAQLSVETQVWQAKAKAQEAKAASLQAQLQQAIIGAQDKRVCRSPGDDGGGVSCAAGAEDAESAYVDPDRVVVSGPKCRGCEKRVASVVVLPCRHLCICTECDKHFRACPVCLTVKNFAVQVFLS